MPQKYSGKVQVVCQHCGNHFLVRPYQVSTGKALNCSRACKGAAQTAKAKREGSARFWAKVDKSGGPLACWPWRGGFSDNGYGIFRAGGVRYYAHRFAWIDTNGPIPDELFVCHHCDFKPCCNPSHYFLGTCADNMADMVAKGRALTGDRNPSRAHIETVQRGEGHWSHRTPNQVMRGDTHANAKLNAEKVRDIRSRYAAGGTSLYKLADEFGVSVKCIHSVVQRKNWRHVA